MRPRLIVLSILALVALVACGGAPAASAPTAAPEATARPTSTPRPTPKPRPTDAPEPTEAPDEPEPTAATGELVTLPVDMDNLETYTYETGIFSIDIPGSWEVEDNSSETEILVRFADENNNAVVLANLFEMEQELSEDELISILSSYLDSTYSENDGFSQEEPSVQSDGSVLIVWGYDTELSTGDTTRLLGNTFIEQRDQLVSVLTIAVPDEQFDDLEPSINDVLNSYSIDTSVALNAEPAPAGDTGELSTVEMQNLETYTYENGLFSINVPESWQLTDNSKSGEAILLWTDPAENGLLVVDILAEPSERSQEELVSLLQDFLNNAFSEQPDFSMDEPQEQSDGSTLVVWSYTATASNGAEAPLLGNSFVEQRGDKISILTLAVPSAQFDGLREPINEILNSYSIDPSADLP